MEILPCPLPGVVFIQPQVHRDARGFFIETYHAPRYREAGVDTDFVQDNQSSSVRGTLRGLHAQLKRPQAKLLRCSQGEIFDVAVDVRKGSPSFGKWFGAVLSADNARQLYVPAGFVHGFAVLSERALVEYKCSDVYVPDDQLSVLWNDPAIGVDWGIQDPILSMKDSQAKPLAELMDLLPSFKP
jgi:dTDP-4-dehydrorhamnose 3,5-epimerase